MRKWSRITLLSMAACIVPPALVYSAAEMPVPVVHGEVIRDFARITFEWPRTTYLDASVHGNVLTVTFDRRGNPRFGHLLSKLSPYITKAETLDGGKRMRFTLNHAYRIRSFVSGNVSGVDILNVKGARKLEAAAPKHSPASPAPHPPVKIAKRPSPPAPSPVPQAKTDTAEHAAAAAKLAISPLLNIPQPDLLSRLVPSAGYVPPPPKPVTPAAAPEEHAAESPAPAQPAAATNAPPAPAAPESPATEPPAPAEPSTAADTPLAPAAAKPSPAAAPEASDAAVPVQPSTTTDAPPAQAASEPPPAEEKPAAQPVDDKNTLRIFAKSDEAGSILRFPFRERIAVAVFQRGDNYWMVFSKPIHFDLAAVRETAPDLMRKLQSFEVGGNTVLMLTSSGGIGSVVTRVDNSFEWNIRFASPVPPPREKLKVDVSTQGPLPPHAFVPVLESAEPVTIKDPDIEDSLIVVPFYQPGQAIMPRRQFVEFNLPETSQGMVVQKVADDVTVTPIRNGLRITTTRGAVLSPDLPAPAAAAPPPPQDENTGTLFPNEEWKAVQGKTFREHENLLLEGISESKSPQETNALRVRLAKLYLSEGHAVEALAVLQNIQRVDPEFFAQQKLVALTGVARFLMYRFQEASQDFLSPDLLNVQELDYWRNVLGDLLGAPSQTLDFLAYDEPFISKYPPLIRQRLIIMAADRAITAGNDSEALRILETLKDETLASDVSDYIAFLMARINVNTGKDKEGVEALKSLAGNLSNPFVRARAEFALIGDDLKNHRVKPEDALERLELLRLSWRGDSLEMNVLTLLGDIYSDRKEYTLALRVWRDLVTLFPRTAAATEAQARMRNAFTELFEKGLADSLRPFDQLALYYEFKDLLPTGDAGTRILEGLADKLSALDLLDQAGGLLEQRMRYAYEKADRSRIGAKLARVQLMNRQPQKAIEALQSSVFGNNNEELRTERDRLAAHAMIDLGQYENAFQLLKSDKSTEAEEIRADAYWQRKEWKNLIASLETLLKSRPASTTILTAGEGERLVKLALAYAVENDTSQLQYLRDYFLPLMKGNQREQLFAFITQPEIPVTPERFNEMLAEVESTRDFIAEYHVVPLAARLAGPETQTP